MLDAALLRTQSEEVKKKIALKNADPGLVDRFVELDASWRTFTTEIETLRAEQKKLGAARDIAGATKLKEQIKEKETTIAEIEKERDVVWRAIPNLPSDDTPPGKDESANQVLRTWGEPTPFDFKPLDHLELGEKLGIINMERAGEVSGTRFAYLMRDAVLLEFALVQHVMHTLGDVSIVKKIADEMKPGYHATPFVPVVPPVMIRPDVYREMARLDASTEDERYYLPADDIYLVGSAEHTLGPLHRGEIIPAEKLPIRYIGFSTSFRREAGSYGRDTRGIIRVHQFDKLEMESFSVPEEGMVEQDFFVAVQEYLVRSLKIPYRVVMISTGDQGSPDIRQVDIEMWMPSQDTYRETHTADYMGDYQARRLNTRVRRPDNSTAFAHMNDATAFAIGRTLVSIMENYQQADGSILVPEVLRPYVGKDRIGGTAADTGTTS